MAEPLVLTSRLVESEPDALTLVLRARNASEKARTRFQPVDQLLSRIDGHEALGACA